MQNKIVEPEYVAYIPNEDTKLDDTFIFELNKTLEWDDRAKHLIRAIESKDYRLKSWKPSKDSHVHPTIFMVVCRLDRIMIKWAKICNMPRGFPIQWWPGEKIKFGGFRGKFKNDGTGEVPLETSVNACGFFKKWSGYLGQLLTWGGKYWTTLSKNSANTQKREDSSLIFPSDMARIISKYITIGLINALEKTGAHVCGEVMSKNDQCHGSEVLNEDWIVTTIGEGCELDLVKSRLVNPPEKGYTKFWGFKDTIKFCKENQLPISGAILATGSAAKELMVSIGDQRDFMDNDTFQELIKSIVTKFPKSVKYIAGNRSHTDILGKALEGLVVHAVTDHDGELETTLLDMLETGETKIIKVKFPGYTGRTMGLREGLGQGYVLSEFLVHIEKWAKRWCLDESAKDYWKDFYTLVWFKCQKDTDNKNPISPHIRYSDIVKAEYDNCCVVDELKDEVTKLIKGSQLEPIGPITLIVPFANGEADFKSTKQFLEEKGKTVLLPNQKLSDTNVKSWIKLISMPNKNDSSTGPVFSLPPIAKESWHEKKIKSGMFTSNWIRQLNSIEELDTSVITYFKEQTNLKFEKSKMMKLMDDKLVASVSTTTDMIKVKMSELEASAKKGIFMLTGPQAIGKSTFCDQMNKVGCKVKVVSADLIMGVTFRPEILIECHQKCQLLCLQYTLEGYHVLVDNTNMKRIDCTIYEAIAKATDSIIVPVIFGPEFWLNSGVTDREEFIEILDSRCQIREIRTGKSIPRKAIERTIENALNDFKTVTGKQAQDTTTMEEINRWLNHFPIPQYKEGFGDERGALMWRSSILTECCSKSLEGLRGKDSFEKPTIKGNIDVERVKCMIMRGRDEFHITTFTPKEVKYLKTIIPLDDGVAYCDIDVCCESANIRINSETHYCKECSPIDIDLTGHKNAFQAIKSILQKEESKPTCMGVGKASANGEQVLFEVVKWDKIKEIRNDLNLDDKDFHSTLAWTGINDIQGIPKGHDTLIP